MTQKATEANLDQAIDQFWDTVPRVWHIIHGHVRAIAAEQFGISVEQIHVLRHIRKGLTSVKDIAEARPDQPPRSQPGGGKPGGKGTDHPAGGSRRPALCPPGTHAGGRGPARSDLPADRAWMRARMASLTAAQMESITEGLALLKSTFDSPVE